MSTPPAASLDLRPGYRAWPQLPVVSANAQSLVQYALQAEAPWTPLAGPEALPTLLRQWLPEAGWAVVVDAGSTAPFVNALREIEARYYRFTAASLHDLPQLLASLPQLAVFIAPLADATTGEHLDLEEVFFAVKKAHPGAFCVADLSGGLGLVPYYHTAWGADATLVLRRQLGYGVAAQQQHLPNALPPAQTRPVLLQHLQAAQMRSLPEVWNTVHAEARAFRAGLAELGAVLTPATPGPAFTAFRFPEKPAPVEVVTALQTQGYRLGLGRDVHGEAHVILQHAPEENDAAIRRLLAALTAVPR